MCRSLRDEITSGEKLGFEVEYEGEDLFLEEERTSVFGKRNLNRVTYNIMRDWKNSANMIY